MKKMLLVTVLVAAMADMSMLSRNGELKALMSKVLWLTEENDARILKIHQLEEEMEAMKIEMDIGMEVATCPRGLFNPRTGQDSALVACVAGVCPDPVPENTCHNLASVPGILLIGGWSNNNTMARGPSGCCELSSSSLYPASPGCSPPTLGEPRLNTITFTTHTGLVAACGGATTSCLVIKDGVWKADPRVPDLTRVRAYATAVSVPGGILVIGGGSSRTARSSVILGNGNSSWEEGPRLLGRGASRACSISLGESVFLIGGKSEEHQVRELNMRTWEWEEEGKWPQLGGGGRVDHACGVFNSKLIVTGGGESRNKPSDTTLILDLTGGPGTNWVEGGRLHSARYGHAMVTMGLAGQEKLFVIGGSEGGQMGDIDRVEVWQEETRSWEEEEERLPEGRQFMGAVAVTRALVCPV